MAFVHSHRADTPVASDVCFIIQGDRLLARKNQPDHLQLPSVDELAGFSSTPRPLGQLDGGACWLSSIADTNAAPPAGWEWHETRMLLGSFTPAQMHAVSCARQLAWWETQHRFCGCCGTPTIEVEDERARRCPKCSALFFPNSSPAVIIAITRGDQILLAHNRNFRPGMFSLLAGFVDPGETLEQAAIREVREEVNIEIGELRYVTSQPWPFPNSLMLGFRAQHVSGELVVDGKEIEQAGWFTRETLPEIPRVGTVARLIIDSWLRE